MRYQGRDQQWRLARTLREEGRTWVDIAERLRHQWPNLNARAAIRIAHGWTQDDAANEWNRLFDPPVKTYKDISDMETRRPGFTTLNKLARLYQCAVTDLIATDPDVGDYRHLDPAATQAQAAVPAPASAALKPRSPASSAPDPPPQVDHDRRAQLAACRLPLEIVRDTGHGPTTEASYEHFERRYMDHVTATLGRLELFGVSRGRARRTHSFDEAFVNVAVARSGRRAPGPRDSDEDLTGGGIDVASSFWENRRVLLRGGAGAGKTTLLQWLAVTAHGLWEDPTAKPTLPFFVPMRQLARYDLPGPEGLLQVTARAIAAEKPPAWVGNAFGSGRALLLIDGVDELEPKRRRDVREWLEQITAAYHRLRVVITARPFAIPEDWLATSGFVTFDLLPLSLNGIREFLTRWHDAAREEHEHDPEMRQWLDDCEQGLASQLATRADLRRLAGSPLLCGLLCALHQSRDRHLPRDRKALYEAALEWLLERWDSERGVPVDEWDWPHLSREEQLVLLQRFAYSMVKNSEVVVSRDEAARRIEHAMRGLRSRQLGVEPVVQRILERGGVLREPNPEDVQFVHRTFRDYLAAREVVDSGDLAFMVEQAHRDDWHDVVVNTVALARPQERDRLLRRLLEGNSAAKADHRIKSRLQLVAVACLEQADVLDSDEARRRVQQAAEQLIPPASLDEADVLARAGPFVLELLPGPEGLTNYQAACVVRAAAMIGSEGVREKLAEFVTVGESQVIDELLRAWRRSEDPGAYARAVLAEVHFGDRRLEVRGWHRIVCLKYLTRLKRVACYGDFGSLDPIVAVPRLQHLELVQNEMIRDLTPLAGCRGLRALYLTSGCQFLRDLSPLADTAIEELSLHLIKADLGTLRGEHLRRLTIRDLRLTEGLTSLPASLPLRELILDNLPSKRNLVGVERLPLLEHVSVRGVPRQEEVRALAELPALRALTIKDPATDDPNLSGVRSALPHVQIRTTPASVGKVAAAVR